LGQFQVSSGGVQANGNHWDQVGPIEMEILMGMGRSWIRNRCGGNGICIFAMAFPFPSLYLQ